MDLKDKIKVMQHFAEGGKVEYRCMPSTTWKETSNPIWDWALYTYRIRQSPIAAGHNLPNLTEDQVECDKGWRLLEEHEIKPSISTRRNELPPNVLQMWLPEDERWDLEFWPGGNDRSCTYRTLLYPADLAKYDIQPPKTKQPLTAADFPPGTVIRWKTQDKRSWTSIVAVTPHEIRLGNGNTISYSASLSIHSILDENNLEYSTDQGKTWLPCYKEV